MNKTTAVLLLAAGIAGAQDQPATKKVPAKKPVNQPAPVTIPANAVETEDGSFRAVDKQGKAWIYRKTPFGIAKSAEKPPVQQPQQEDTLTKAKTDGDTVHYERPTPFGTAKWDGKAANAAAKGQEDDTLTTAKIDGDTVHFERPTPFGAAKWDKKMSKLDANEQRIVDRQKMKQ